MSRASILCMQTSLKRIIWGRWRNTEHDAYLSLLKLAFYPNQLFSLEANDVCDHSLDQDTFSTGVVEGGIERHCPLWQLYEWVSKVALQNLVYWVPLPVIPEGHSRSAARTPGFTVKSLKWAWAILLQSGTIKLNQFNIRCLRVFWVKLNMDLDSERWNTSKKVPPKTFPRHFMDCQIFDRFQWEFHVHISTN